MDSRAASTTGAGSTTERRWLLLAVLLHLCLGGALTAMRPPDWGDEKVYLSAGYGFASGQGNRFVRLPYDQRVAALRREGQENRVYPPGLPLLLSLALRLGLTDARGLRLIPLLAGALSLAILYHWRRLLFGDRWRVVLLMVATSQAAGEMGVRLLSEPFLLVTVSALFVTLRGIERQPTRARGRFALAALLGALAVELHTKAVLLLAGVLLWLLLRQRGRVVTILLFAAANLLLFLPWLASSLFWHHPWGLYMGAIPEQWEWLGRLLPDWMVGLIWRFTAAPTRYLQMITPVPDPDWVPLLANGVPLVGALLYALRALLAPIFWVGLVRGGQRRAAEPDGSRVIPISVVTYLVLCTIQPWAAGRLALVVLPWMIDLLILGLGLDRLCPRPRAALLGCLAVLWAAGWAWELGGAAAAYEQDHVTGQPGLQTVAPGG